MVRVTEKTTWAALGETMLYGGDGKRGSFPDLGLEWGLDLGSERGPTKLREQGVQSWQDVRIRD